MTTKLKRPCRYPRCPRLTDDRAGYCDEHRAQAHRDYRRSRTDDDEQRFYGSRAWREASEDYRRRHPICEECGERPSVLVHHRKHVKDGGARMDERNFRAVCRRCQALAHRRGEDG